MTKQHFKALAEALYSAKPKPYPGDNMVGKFRTAVWESCVIEIAEVCKQFNSRFNEEVFFKACEYEGENTSD